MQFINKTGLVLIGAAFLSAPVFVGCDDDKDSTDLGGGSGGTAGTAGTAGSAGSAGEAGSSGAGGDGGDSGSGGSAGEGGTGGTGGSAGDPDAGDGGVNPLIAFAEAVCTTWGELAFAPDAGADGGGGGITCTTPSTCVDQFSTAPPGCETEFAAYLECMSTQPVSASECADPTTPQFRLCSEGVRTAFGGLPDCGANEHDCLDQECAFQACVLTGTLDVECN